MKYKHLVLCAGLLLGTLSLQLHAAGMTQKITPGEESFAVLPGDTVDFPIIYASDQENSTGVGVQLSFDSKKLQFLGFTEKMEKDLLASDNVSRAKSKKKEDDSNKANNKNDTIAGIAWMSVDGSWPGQGELPITLGVAHFKVLETANDSVTTIDIEGDGAAQSTLSAKDVTVTIGQGNQALAVSETGNGAGAGGSLTWLFIPFFLALALLKRTLRTRRFF